MVYLVWYYSYDSDLDDYTVELEDVFESRELAEETLYKWNAITWYTWVRGQYRTVFSIPHYLKSGALAAANEFWMIEEREVLKREG